MVIVQCVIFRPEESLHHQGLINDKDAHALGGQSGGRIQLG